MSKSKTKPKFHALGRKVTTFSKLETFPCPDHVSEVILTSDEVTAVCPVTGQPDWYVVEIDYIPRHLCVESKSLKLYLQSFRNAGHFCEKFSDIIARQIAKDLCPQEVTVVVTQKPRGGVAIKSTSTILSDDE